MEVREFDDLPGVRTYDLKILPDERGFFTEAFRRDWINSIANIKYRR